MKKNEADIQKKLVEILSMVAERDSLFFFSIPNEGAMTVSGVNKTDKKIMAKIINMMRGMGMVAGIPDMCIMRKEKTLFLELKSKGRKPTTNQKLIHDIMMERTNTKVIVADNLGAAVEAIENFFKIEIW